MEKKDNEKFGFAGLTAIAFGMMVGSGIFNIPQNMAAYAGPAGVAVAWIITAAGMMLLSATFKTLADRRPDLNAGIYQYAQAGFGNYAGFNTAWGYWLCTCSANVAYAVMLCDSIGAFFPSLVNNGKWILLCGSVFIWLMCFIVSRGIKTARIINNIMSAAKVAVISAIILLLFLNFRLGTFNSILQPGPEGLGGLGQQVKNTMLVTLWCFIGIEGAVMMSARAKRSDHVGKAGIAGFLLAWLMYLLISLLSFGVMTQPEIATLDNPSVAYLLKAVCGDWAYYFVIISVIVSLLGGWVAWTMVCAEVAFEAAGAGIFPKMFMRLNGKGMPAFGLAVSSVVMQAFLVIVVSAHDFYMAALSITGMMVLPSYLFSGIYLWKTTLNPSELGLDYCRKNMRFRLTAIACSAFCIWMIYAGGLGLLLLTSLFYLPGIAFFVKARRQTLAAGHGENVFTPAEKVALGVLAACSAASVWLLSSGLISL